MRRRRWILLAVFGLLALTLAACWVLYDGIVDAKPPDRVATYVPARCPRNGAELPRFDEWNEMIVAGRLPPGFRPVRALHCIANSNGDPADPSSHLLRYEISETRADPVGADFLQVLALPDQKFGIGSHGGCPAVATSPSWVLLIDDAGRAVMPRLPQDPCGEPRTEVVQAVSGLGFHDEVIHRFEADVQAMRVR